MLHSYPFTKSLELESSTLHKIQLICDEPEILRTLILRDPDINLIIAAGSYEARAPSPIRPKKNSSLSSVSVGMIVYFFLLGLGLLMSGGFSLNISSAGVGLLSSGGIIVFLVLLLILTMILKSCKR